MQCERVDCGFSCDDLVGFIAHQIECDASLVARIRAEAERAYEAGDRWGWMALNSEANDLAEGLGVIEAPRRL